MNEIAKQTKRIVPAKPNKKNTRQKSSTASWNPGTVIMSILLVALLIACVYFLTTGISIGADALSDAYDSALNTEKSTVYQSFYDNAFERAKKYYHVSEKIIISVDNLVEISKLEVLKVNAKEFIAENSDDNEGNVTAWLEVTGEGTFVVDLKAAEFIIDNIRQSVLVRIPSPELTDIVLLTREKVFFADDWANGSYREGIALAEKMEELARVKITQSLMSNQFIYGEAKEVAERMIINLVKQFNQDITDLCVAVKFVG